MSVNVTEVTETYPRTRTAATRQSGWDGQADADGDARGQTFEPLRGAARALVGHMESSLGVPTATSVRAVPAKLIVDNRDVINDHLDRARGGRISFTHLLGWAVVTAVRDFPELNSCYDVVDGRPVVATPSHLNLGIAVDVTGTDGSRGLVVPNVKNADRMDFPSFVRACDDLVARARGNGLTPEDFAGTTLSLTNPGGTGTVHSVPRLMRGQGCVVAAGALEYPAEYRGAGAQTLADLAVGKTVTLTSTYDHRVIQGAASGEFLRRIHQLLTGADRFYDGIFAALRIPYVPVLWSEDVHVDPDRAVDKTARAQALIDAFRVRGHLMADTDPLVYQQRTHPDLEIENHGLSFWDLDRAFVTDDLAAAGARRLPLREILRVLRDTYCRTVGVEYMHIQDPVQRRWFRTGGVRRHGFAATVRMRFREQRRRLGLHPPRHGRHGRHGPGPASWRFARCGPPRPPAEPAAADMTRARCRISGGYWPKSGPQLTDIPGSPTEPSAYASRLLRRPAGTPRSGVPADE